MTDVDSETSSFMTAVLIAANVLLIATVAVQTALLVRGLYSPEPVVEHLTPVSSFFRNALRKRLRRLRTRNRESPQQAFHWPGGKRGLRFRISRFTWIWAGVGGARG